MNAHPLAERTFARVLRDKAERNGDRPYILFEGRRISYAEVDAISNRIANGLIAAGAAPGMHVAVMMDNKPEQLLAYFALGKFGGVSVPINTAAKGDMLLYFLSQSDAAMILVDAPLAGRVAEVLDRVPAIRKVFVLDETGSGNVLADWPGPVPAHDFREILDGPPHPPQPAGRFNDVFMFLYTSGTTGPSKANMSTQCHALTCGMTLAEAYGYGPDDILYVCLPIFHGNAFLCSCLPALMADGAVAISRRFSASGFWDEIRRYGATQFNSLGAMTNFLWSRPEAPEDADNPVRQCMVVPVPREFYHAFEKRFRLRFTSLYALTDAAILTITRKDDPPGKFGSAGRPCEGIHLRIVDDDDLELPPGEIGEIIVRSEDPWILCQGYYGMPEATLGAWRNLWFHTGDRGYLDEDGYLYFADRKKDAIRRRGENISSFEVEQIILKNEAVLEVAAFPVTSEHSEDEVMVTVVLREGARLAADELIGFCARNMPYFMVPRYVEFVPALPKTMTEKVEKYKLRAAAEARLSEIWDREAAGIEVVR